LTRKRRRTAPWYRCHSLRSVRRETETAACPRVWLSNASTSAANLHSRPPGHLTSLGDLRTYDRKFDWDARKLAGWEKETHLSRSQHDREGSKRREIDFVTSSGSFMRRRNEMGSADGGGDTPLPFEERVWPSPDNPSALAESSTSRNSPSSPAPTKPTEITPK